MPQAAAGRYTKDKEQIALRDTPPKATSRQVRQVMILPSED